MALTNRLEEEALTLPYAPSWLDRLTRWVDGLPGPYWAYYLGLGLALFGLLTAIKWLDGTHAVGTLSLRLFEFTLWGMYILTAVHHLDRHAQYALESFRPALMPSDAQYRQLLYRLTTSPAPKVLLASVLFLLWGLLSSFWNPEYVQVTQMYTSTAATVLELGILISYYLIGGAAIYHVLHQLAMVNRIYLVCTSIDPLRPQPLYSLAGLASRAALFALLLQYAWWAVSPAIFVSSAFFLTEMLIIALAVVLLIWPLWGAHSLLLKEKLRLQAEAQTRMGDAFTQLHQHMDQGDFSRIDGVNKAMSGLQIELNILEKLPTWPWHPDTPRLLFTAILLPLVVWLAQRILGRVGL